MITYSLGATAPVGATIDALTGEFTWTPTEGDGPGSYDIDVIATDNGPSNLTDTRTLTVTVTEVNVAPVLAAVGDRSGDENSLITFTASAADPDEPEQQLAFSLSGLFRVTVATPSFFSTSSSPMSLSSSAPATGPA